MVETRIQVRLRPRGHADELIGINGVLHARVAAPPVEGVERSALIGRLGA